MRGVPLIVFLYWLYNAAASQGWFVLSEFRSGALALGLTGSGYMAENYRGALQSVERRPARGGAGRRARTGCHRSAR